MTAALHDALGAVAGIEAPLLQALKDTTATVISAETAAISQAGSVIQADLAPVIQQLSDFNATVATVAGLLQDIRTNGVELQWPSTPLRFGIPMAPVSQKT